MDVCCGSIRRNLDPVLVSLRDMLGDVRPTFLLGAFMHLHIQLAVHDLPDLRIARTLVILGRGPRAIAVILRRVSSRVSLKLVPVIP